MLSDEPNQVELCASCGTPYMETCDQRHHHDAYCISISDTRALHCGCTAHKECQKSGNECLVHGGSWEWEDAAGDLPC